eukprot:scaffold5169_cov172-Amphora_coffeaeformis.AAC.15
MAEATKDSQPPKMKALEAKAVDKAKATADAAFKPSMNILNAKTADALINLVDGPEIASYDAKESVYAGRTIPIGAGKSLTVPIQVTVPGSVVEYSIEVDNYDVGLAIDAERDEGVTIVKELTRVSSDDSPLKQKFLVGTIPCLIKFSFTNDYSWMREKLVSYKITVTPPSKESLLQSRRSRASTCLKAVQADLKQQFPKLEAVQATKKGLQAEVEKLQKQLQEKQKALEEATAEETFLKERKALRLEQERLLNERLKSGWKDEAALNGGKK